MPDTIVAALILVLAVVPGSLGVYVFAVVNGADWRQKDWEAAVQHVAFSVIGLLAYVLAARLLNLLPAAHVTPSAYRTVDAATLHLLLLPYVGHLAGGALIGLLAALGDRIVSRLSKSSFHASAWNSFATTSLQDRWVVATLTSGDIFAGRIGVADVGVAAAERDIVLREPALFDPTKQNYLATPFYEIFLPSALVQNVGVLARDADQRLGPQPGQPLFPQEVADANPRPEADQSTHAS